jgi:hypothetical protein
VDDEVEEEQVEVAAAGAAADEEVVVISSDDDFQDAPPGEGWMAPQQCGSVAALTVRQRCSLTTHQLT